MRGVSAPGAACACSRVPRRVQVLPRAAYDAPVAHVHRTGRLRDGRRTRTAAAVVAIAAVTIAALLAAGPAAAAGSTGGTSIATAPSLPLGRQITHATRRPEYWRVEMGPADELVVDLGSTNSRFSAEVCVLDPDVNDYSSDQAPCRAMAATNMKRQLRFRSPGLGRWTVVAWGCTGCTLFNPSGASYASYELTAYVRRFTAVTLLAPSRVRAGARMLLRGSVQGASGGLLQLARRLPGGLWVPLGTATIEPDGSFRFRTSLPRRGSVRLAAIYGGDRRHLPSRDAIVVAVG